MNHYQCGENYSPDYVTGCIERPGAGGKESQLEQQPHDLKLTFRRGGHQRSKALQAALGVDLGAGVRQDVDRLDHHLHVDRADVGAVRVAEEEQDNAPSLLAQVIGFSRSGG